MHSLYKLLRSVKLAVVLIVIITVLSILATLFPRMLPDFYRSAVFLAPCALFAVNLSVCAVDRFARRVRSRAKPRFGPDIVHIGLLILIAGGLVTVLGRRESMVYLGKGDVAELPGGYEVQLTDYVFEKYPDGRPRDWISTVKVRRTGVVVLDAFAIEVNRPLAIAGIKIYQTDYGREDLAELSDGSGQTFSITSGKGVTVGSSLYLFRGIEEGGPPGGRALFERWEGHTLMQEYRAGTGETFAGYAVQRLSSRDITGLRAVKDPGFLPVLAALILIGAGLSLTFIQKQGDSSA
jgi:cytochrome c biogenesis protein ResB